MSDHATALRTLKFRDYDPDNISRAGSGIQVEQRLIKPGLLSGQITHLQHGDLFLLIAQFSHGFVLSGLNLPGHWNLSTLMACYQEETRIKGVPIRPSQCHSVLPGAEIHAMVSPGTVFTGLFVPEEIVNRRLADLGIPDPDLDIIGERICSTYSESGIRYARTLDHVKHLSDSGMSMAPVCAEALLRDMLNDYLTTTMGSVDGAHAQDPRGLINRYRIVNKAEEYIRTHADEPIYLDQLCAAAGVSERTLDYAFKSVIGVSPYNYLLALRLNRVRRDLLSSPDPQQSVKAAALGWGFTHLARFSGHYRRLFGELPSVTLARRAANERERASLQPDPNLI